MTIDDADYIWAMSLDGDGSMSMDALEAEGLEQIEPDSYCESPKPSKNTADYWFYATSRNPGYPSHTIRSGKWLIFCKPDEIDDTWREVKRAVEAGKLGSCAKTSTKLSFQPPDYVICVYTYDWKDYDDVYRIRQVLREIGIDKPIPYKTDADTRAGRYAKDKRTQGRVAKYYE